MATYVLGTRGSSLAQCQAQIVQARLEERWPVHRFELHAIKAAADRSPEVPLVALSGEGIFVKELEQALAAGRIHAAVHSLKDLPLDTPEGIRIAAVLAREEPRDALVSRSGSGLDALPRGATIGTSSLRRASQLLHRRPDLQVLEIRGNVDTRLRKLGEGRYDAIVVAAAGLIRLGLEERITDLLDLDVMVPEPGQGAIAVEARAADHDVQNLLAPLEDPISRACTDAERAFLRALGGGCRVPIAAYAEASGGTIELRGVVASPDGRQRLTGHVSGAITEPVSLGERLAQQLVTQGAAALLAAR